jgi:carbon storage regulator
MHVLTRGVQETVRIGSDTTVTIVHIRGDQVRLRVASPKESGIYRKEIVDELRQAAEEALSCEETPGES